LTITGSPLIAGEAEGTLLLLTAPICFWGGLDPVSGTISDPRHPQCGAHLSDKIVAIPAIVGSSSSSQYLLEAMHHRTAPRAILLGENDIIIATAVIVGREMDYPSFPIVQCGFEGLRDGAYVRIARDGQIHVHGKP
jgi:predicted aconitase with swiveling domain